MAIEVLSKMQRRKTKFHNFYQILLGVVEKVESAWSLVWQEKGLKLLQNEIAKFSFCGPTLW